MQKSFKLSASRNAIKIVQFRRKVCAYIRCTVILIAKFHEFLYKQDLLLKGRLVNNILVEEGTTLVCLHYEDGDVEKIKIED